MGHDDRSIGKYDLPPVMILGDHFGYPSGVAHGVTTYYLNVLPALVQAGLDITACFLREPHPAAAPLPAAGIEPIFLSAHPLDPLVVLRVAALARKRRCGIIHGNGIKATLVARMVAPLIGAKAVVHVHDLTYPNLFVSGLHRVFSRSTDMGLCVSQAVQEVAKKGYHVRADRLRVAYNGIRLEGIRNVTTQAREDCRTGLDISASSRVIAMIGRMHAVKGHKGMLQMMPRIIKTSPDVVLLLIGDGPERLAYEAMALQLGLQKQVRFLGHRNDIPSLLAASDVVVIPSLSEGMGLAAVEALAAGKPVVAYGVGGLPEVIDDGHDGIVVKAEDQEAFVQALVSLLNDRQRIHLYGERAALAAERFSLKRHLEVLLSCYRELAGGDGRLPAIHSRDAL